MSTPARRSRRLHTKRERLPALFFRALLPVADVDPLVEEFFLLRLALDGLRSRDDGKDALNVLDRPSEYEDADRAIEDTLKRLDTDYIDLLILHQPVGNFMAGYQAMERAYMAGKVKALGLSNFPEELVQSVIDACRVNPQILQVEAHPYYPQSKLKAYLFKYDIKLMAWYPLGHGDKSLVNEAVFTRLAQKYNKTNAQVILRWHVQSGNVVIPGSKNPAHIAANLDIFDFALTDDEMKEIAALDKNTRYYNMSLEDAAKTYLNIRPDFNDQE